MRSVYLYDEDDIGSLCSDLASFFSNIPFLQQIETLHTIAVKSSKIPYINSAYKRMVYKYVSTDNVEVYLHFFSFDDSNLNLICTTSYEAKNDPWDNDGVNFTNGANTYKSKTGDWFCEWAFNVYSLKVFNGVICIYNEQSNTVIINSRYKTNCTYSGVDFAEIVSKTTNLIFGEISLINYDSKYKFFYGGDCGGIAEYCNHIQKQLSNTDIEIDTDIEYGNLKFQQDITTYGYGYLGLSLSSFNAICIDVLTPVDSRPKIVGYHVANGFGLLNGTITRKTRTTRRKLAGNPYRLSTEVITDITFDDSDTVKWGFSNEFSFTWDSIYAGSLTIIPDLDLYKKKCDFIKLKGTAISSDLMYYKSGHHCITSISRSFDGLPNTAPLMSNNGLDKGKDVNTLNNVSLLFPLYVYVDADSSADNDIFPGVSELRDYSTLPHRVHPHDVYFCLGVLSCINYISMYNIANNAIKQVDYPSYGSWYNCFFAFSNQCARRCYRSAKGVAETTVSDYLFDTSKIGHDDEWGAGYDGIAIMLSEDDVPARILDGGVGADD